MIRGLAVGLMLACPGAAYAADARIRAVRYDPAAIVPVTGRIGIQSTIAFAPDERIENVAIGDSAAWQVTPNRRADLIFLKPMTARARTNMTVVTSHRTYLFDLRAAAPGATAIYALSFTYPDEPPLILPAADKTEQAPLILASANPAPAPKPFTPADLDFAWQGKGSRHLLPSRSFDDGKSLYLAWPKDSAMPAMLAVGADGNEGPVNFTTRGDYVVIDGVPQKLILRSGKEMATLSAVRVVPIPMQTAER
jgi:type IV secretion system protein VirB9